MEKMTMDEWQAKGEKLFGPDRLKWKFKCPICGHVQTANDFKKYKDKGATPNDAYFNCIGRYYDKEVNKPFGEKQSKKITKQPCNFTMGGFLTPANLAVITPDGKELLTFEFAA